MRRALVTFLAASLVLSAPWVSGAGAKPSSGAGATTAAAATIVLRGRTGIEGPWRSYLSLRLVRGGIPVSFSVCAVWGDQPLLTQECRAAPGTRLPEGTMMRLEQRRKAAWRRVGLSTEPALEGVLSNAVSGNRLGTVFYRVRLRQQSGRVLRTSNTFRVIWHK
jgi:hypothetical protein